METRPATGVSLEILVPTSFEVPVVKESEILGGRSWRDCSYLNNFIGFLQLGFPSASYKGVV